MERSLSAPVFLLDPLPDAAELTLEGAEGHHAAQVRRLRVGEAVVVTDGRGLQVRGAVSAVSRGTLTVQVSARRQLPVPAPRVVVAQAIPKGERAELAVELLTEVGVDEIIPWQAAQCVARWDGERAARGLARWQAVAQAAAKQSRRCWFPVVSAPLTTPALAARLAAASCAVVLDAEGAVTIGELALPEQGEVVLVVGPEGGIGPAELAELAATRVRLGAGVLRTSSAGAVAAGVLLSRTARWRGPDGAAHGGYGEQV